MKVKTADLIGPALDWVVAKAEGFNVEPWFKEKRGWLRDNRFSKDWGLAGSIIEREGITLRTNVNVPAHWVAFLDFGGSGTNVKARQRGHTPLIAAMRCFVASRLGDEVDVPDELV